MYFKQDIEIIRTWGMNLPFTSEVNIGGVDIKIKRKIMGSLIYRDDFGLLLVGNTHLCADCPPEQRQDQIEAALWFVNTISGWYHDIPVIFGGDFNIRETDADNASVKANYDAIINSGFSDSYSEDNICFFDTDPCCNPPDTDGCTFAVGANPYTDGDTTRVDYIFYRPENKLIVSDSYVVFGSAPIVSDHAGVKTIFEWNNED
jgi:endonuclease/exonuclease/phosphatase family metal-dependent hydrolase